MSERRSAHAEDRLQFALDIMRAERDAAEAGAAAMRLALEQFFTPGPGVAMPERHVPDWGMPCNITWNKKLDALEAALTADAGRALTEEVKVLRDLADTFTAPGGDIFMYHHKVHAALAAWDRIKAGRKP